MSPLPERARTSRGRQGLPSGALPPGRGNRVLLLAFALLGPLLAAEAVATDGPVQPDATTDPAAPRASASTDGSPVALDLPVLSNAWYFWYPYQYEEMTGVLEELTGLDVELTREIVARTGRIVAYQPEAWQEHIEAVEAGALDMASGATFTARRAAFARFSEPYRFEDNSLFVLSGDAGLWSFEDLDGFLRLLEREQPPLAVVAGYVYADPALNRFLDQHRDDPWIVETANDGESLQLLLNGQVEGFLADRTVGASLLWESETGERVREIRLGIRTPLHLMLSRATVPPAVAEEINAAIREFRGSGEYRNIMTRYLAPVLFLKTVDSRWFRIVELIGTIAFALSGVIIAIEQRSTLLAAIVFAFLPSFGGGTVRDLVVGRAPVGFLDSPFMLAVVVGLVVVAFLADRIAAERLGPFFRSLVPRRLRGLPANPYLLLTDGLGLAAFTVSGVFVTVAARMEPLWFWAPFFAALTGAGGGILRDVLARRPRIVAFSGAPYAEWALLGGFFLSLYLHANAADISEGVVGRGVVVTMVGVFVCRILSDWFQLPNIRFVALRLVEGAGKPAGPAPQDAPPPPEEGKPG